MSELLPLRVFFIDDQEEEHVLFRSAVRLIPRELKCEHFFAADIALQELKERTTALPDIIFSDINMPRMNGYEFLKEIKALPALQNIPVHVLSVDRSYTTPKIVKDLGAASFNVKQNTFKEQAEMLKKILLDFVSGVGKE